MACTDKAFLRPMSLFKESQMYSVWASLLVFFVSKRDERVQLSRPALWQKKHYALPNKKAQRFHSAWNLWFFKILACTICIAGSSALAGLPTVQMAYAAQPQAQHEHSPKTDAPQKVAGENNAAQVAKAAEAPEAPHAMHMANATDSHAMHMTNATDPHAMHRMNATDPHAMHRMNATTGQSAGLNEGRATPTFPVPSNTPAPPDIVERLGNIVPDDIYLNDEDGKPIQVRSLMDIPVVIVPVFFTCPAACNTLQSSMAAVVPNVSLKPGKEFRVITVSFDEQDTPAMAKRKQANFIAATNYTFPASEWRFLTGDKESIRRFMESIGFPYIRKGPGDFSHPVGIIVTAPGGKVVRYMYGQGFMPFDITMACTEAAEGKTGLSIKRVLSYCFAYDPAARGYVFSFMRVVGVIIIFGIAVLLFVLFFGGKKRNKKNQE